MFGWVIIWKVSFWYFRIQLSLLTRGVKKYSNWKWDRNRFEKLPSLEIRRKSCWWVFIKCRSQNASHCPIVQCTTIFLKKFSCDFIWGLPLKFNTDVIINVNSGHLILKIHIWCSYFSPFFFLDCRKCGILKFFLEKCGMGLVWEVLILLDVITVQCSECTLNQLCIFSLILAFKLIFVWLVPEK